MGSWRQTKTVWCPGNQWSNQLFQMLLIDQVWWRLKIDHLEAPVDHPEPESEPLFELC